MLAGVVAPQAEVRSGPEELIHSDESINVACCDASRLCDIFAQVRVIVGA
jgi:hypothetical protein